jgi:hypothetical protein
MIEWDEILEDVDWKRGVAFLIVGLILIGGAVFLGLDMHKANTMKTLLENDEKDMETFEQTWAAPDSKEIADLQKELKQAEADYAALGVDLPDAVDQDAIIAKIKKIAASDNVQIVKVSPTSGREEYCSVLELGLVFSSSQQGNALNFLTDLSRMPEPHAVRSQPVSLLTGTMDVTVEFYSFDHAGWDEINNCALKLSLPLIPDRDISDIYVFQSGLADLKAKVDQENAGLKTVKIQFTKGCELQTRIDMIKTKIKIVKQKTKK